jgi:thiol-disulfide isomerase/thioredoxin
MIQNALSTAFNAAVSYDDYLSASPKHADGWRAVDDRVTITTQQQELLGSFTRDMRVLVISGSWCGDCVRQGPPLAAIAQGAPRIDLRFIDRDHADSPIEHFIINAGSRVPVAIFMAEDGELVSSLGDKTISYYRWVAAQQLGPACPLPGAPIPEDVLASITQDWIDECERVQLLLRLSPRLRGVHGD